MTQKDWRKVELQEVCTEVTVGHVGPMATEYVQNGVPFLRSLNIKPYRIDTNEIRYITPAFHQKLGKSRLNAGDVVIVRTGAPGICTVIPDWIGEANCSDLVIARPGRDVLPEYLAYVVNVVAAHHVDAFTVGAVQQHFNVGAAKKISFALPPLDQQKDVVSFIEAISDKIELNRRMNETLEGMAQAIFRDWFVDFGPTRAKLAGHAPYLAPDLWALFPDAITVDDVPLGWKPHSLDQLAVVHREKIRPVEHPEQLFEHYSLPAYDASTQPKLERGVTILSDKTYVPRGSVLVSKLNPEIPRVWLPADPKSEPQIASTEFLALTPTSDSGRLILYFLFKGEKVRQEMRSMATGTSKSHQRVALLPLLSLQALTSARSVMQAFESIASDIMRMTQLNLSQSSELAEIRDYLLPKLMSGEITVGEAETLAATVE